MELFVSAIDTLKTLVIVIGVDLGVWGMVNLLKDYGPDDSGAKSQGIKQLMSDGGVILIRTTLIPPLSGLFN